MTPLIALCILACSKTQPNLNYQTYGSRVPVILKELSQQTGSKLTCSPELDNEVLVIRVDDVPLDSLLEKIAKVASARWVTTDDGRELQPDTKQQNEEARAHQARLEDSIQKALNKLNQQIARFDREEKELAGSGSDTRSHAQERLIIKLAQSIPAKVYASVDRGERLVFGTNPTDMQRPLDLKDYQNLIEQWISYNNERHHKLAGRSDLPDIAMLEFMKLIGQPFVPLLVEETPAKALLVIENHDGLASRVVSLGFYSPEGDRVLSTTLQLKSKSEQPQAEETIEPMAQDAKVLDRWSVAQELAQYDLFVPNDYMAMIKPPISRRAAEILMRADLYDPIALEGGDLLAFTSRELGKDLVACLPDREGTYSQQRMRAAGEKDQRSPTVRSVRLKYGSSSFKATHEDGWWIITPSDPHLSRSIRFDRLAFAKLLQEGREHAVAPLSLIADYAADHPSFFDDFQLKSRVYLLAPSLIPSADFGFDPTWDSLELYGRLDDGQRSAFCAGRAIPLRSLSKKARVSAEKIFYGTPGQLQILTSAAFDPFIGANRGYVDGGMSKHLSLEPTQVAPRGILDGELRALVSKEPYVMEESDGHYGKPLGADDLVMLKFAMTTQPTVEGMTTLQLKNLKVGERLMIRGGVYINQRVGAKFSLLDHSDPSKEGSYSLGQLPDGLADLVAKRDAAFKASPFYKFYQSSEGAGPGQEPPPID